MDSPHQERLQELAIQREELQIKLLQLEIEQKAAQMKREEKAYDVTVQQRALQQHDRLHMDLRREAYADERERLQVHLLEQEIEQNAKRKRGKSDIHTRS